MGNNVRRKNIASGYLRGNAAEWYETDQANIAQWHIDGQNDNFRERFKGHFSPQSKQIQWQFELTNIRQGTGESIEDYSRRFRSVMRKVNHTNALAAGVQVNYFIKGLNNDVKSSRFKCCSNSGEIIRNRNTNCRIVNMGKYKSNISKSGK